MVARQNTGYDGSMSGRATGAGRGGWHALMAHPLFSTIVILWFAAAFALSALAVSGALMERMVLASQIDLILPMASPPLGATARMLIAAGFGAVGALLGWLATRMLVPRAAEGRRFDSQEMPDYRWLRRRQADMHPDAPARRPILAHAELGAQGFDHAPAAPAPFAPPTPAAPPAQMPLSPAPVAPPPAEAPAIDPPVFVHPEPLIAPLPVEPVAPPPAPAQESLPPAFTPAPQLHVVENPPAPAPTVSLGAFPTPPVDKPSAADQIAGAPIESLSHVELIARLAQAMERRRAAEETPAGARSTPPTPAPDGTGDALRAALAALRDVK